MSEDERVDVTAHSSAAIRRVVAWTSVLIVSYMAFLQPASGQSYKVLHSFGIVSDRGAASPSALVQAADGNFYGTTESEGKAFFGTVFKISSRGTYIVLHSFGDGSVPHDGKRPASGLIQARDGNFYGTTAAGGAAGKGTVFRISPSGTEAVIHSFGDRLVPEDGVVPVAGLIEGRDGALYGTTKGGGSADHGAIFKITLTGTTTILHSFGDGTVPHDGQEPSAALIQGGDGNFYGTTKLGGTSNAGTIYKTTPSGESTIVHAFCDGSVPQDGQWPTASLFQTRDGSLYSVTEAGGAAGGGVVVRVTTSGSVSIIHSFGGASDNYNDGDPCAGLIEARDGRLYGTTSGGELGSGSVYAMTLSGEFTTLHKFPDSSVKNDGIYSFTSLVQGKDGNLYGTTSNGGATGKGVLFAISLTNRRNPTPSPPGQATWSAATDRELAKFNLNLYVVFAGTEISRFRSSFDATHRQLKELGDGFSRRINLGTDKNWRNRTLAAVNALQAEINGKHPTTDSHIPVGAEQLHQLLLAERSIGRTYCSRWRKYLAKPTPANISVVVDANNLLAPAMDAVVTEANRL